MKGLMEEQSQVRILRGYYDCHEVQRGDIVAYDYGEDNKILIKRAEGIPGDHFSIKDVSDGRSQLLINQVPLKTSDGTEILLDTNQKQILSMYIDSYNGVIPENSYLIFGNVPAGSIDSTHFGLVGKHDIVGKIIVENP